MPVIDMRVQSLDGIMPVRYISDAIRGLIRHHTGSSQYQKIEQVMVQTEVVMAQNNEQDAGVMAEMLWSSALKIKGVTHSSTH